MRGIRGFGNMYLYIKVSVLKSIKNDNREGKINWIT